MHLTFFLAALAFLAAVSTPRVLADKDIEDKVEDLRTVKLKRKPKTWKNTITNMIDLLVYLYDKYESETDDSGTNCPEINQFAFNVTEWSSQWNAAGWSAQQAQGAPNGISWCPQTASGSNEYLELQYNTPVKITQVHIVVKSEGGKVTAIKAKRQQGGWDELYNSQIANIWTFDLTCDFPSKEIRIEFDCTTPATWLYVDAVKVIGHPVSG